MVLSRQPVKGIFFTFASAVVGIIYGFVLLKIYGISYGAGTLFFTICFTYFWHLGWSFMGWPASLFTKSRWTQGVFNYILSHCIVWLTFGIWVWVYGKPFYETPVGLWGQTTIIAAVISIFFFANQLLLPADQTNKQPLAGFTNVLWGVLFFPLALFFIPQMWGLPPGYIPWIWFPIALIPIAYFGGWPFDRLGVYRAGISYMGVVFLLTLIMLGAFNFLNMGFFDSGAPGLKASLFVATWTNVGLLCAWMFNLWPVGTLKPPLRGMIGLLGTLLVSIIIYLWLMATFSEQALPALIFWQFSYMWGMMFFAGPGYANVFWWGYEENPLGAGVYRRNELCQPD
jgi:hypothetical protein